MGGGLVNGRQKVVDYLKILNDLSLAQRRRLCGEEWIFQQDDALITKYFLEPKIRLLDYLACSPDFNPITKIVRLIVAKVYEGGRQYSAISELKNAILDARFNFRN